MQKPQQGFDDDDIENMIRELSKDHKPYVAPDEEEDLQLRHLRRTPRMKKAAHISWHQGDGKLVLSERSRDLLQVESHRANTSAPPPSPFAVPTHTQAKPFLAQSRSDPSRTSQPQQPSSPATTRAKLSTSKSEATMVAPEMRAQLQQHQPTPVAALSPQKGLTASKSETIFFKGISGTSAEVSSPPKPKDKQLKDEDRISFRQSHIVVLNSNANNTTPARMSSIQICSALISVASSSLHFYLRIKEGRIEVNYKEWAKTNAFTQFEDLAFSLQKADITDLAASAERVCFWINVYNSLVIHAYTSYGSPAKEKRRKTFFTDCVYKIGECSYSLLDISHIIWKEKTKKDDIPTSRHDFDTQVFFSLFTGTKSSPYLHAYTPNNLSTLLPWVTHVYLDQEVEVSFTKSYIVLPKIFQNHVSEFGPMNEQLLMWISHYLNEEKAKIMRFVIRCEDCEIKYKEYDWSPTAPKIVSVLV